MIKIYLTLVVGGSDRGRWWAHMMHLLKLAIYMQVLHIGSLTCRQGIVSVHWYGNKKKLKI